MEEHEEQGGNRVEVPPGFRFHPTDEELINCYLRRKVMSSSNHHFELDHVIREIDLNKLEPWDLREKCKVNASSHQTEWYFFSHKDKKYPTGMRTNRATKAGFWKATGRDKAVFTSSKSGGQQRIGMRKTLVFYKGRAPNGLKTDWIMHEYRLVHDQPSQINSNFIAQSTSNCSNGLKEDGGWVVCRVFKKRNYEERMTSHANSNLSDEEESSDKTTKREGYANHESTINHNSKNDFSCKQEFIEEEAPKTTGFLQLPQLESPKLNHNTNISCGLPNSMINNLHDNSLMDYKRVQLGEGNGQSRFHQLSQYTQSLQMQEALLNQGKQLIVSEEELSHYAENNHGHVVDTQYHWNACDNLVRLQGIDCTMTNPVVGDQFFHNFNAHLYKTQPPLDCYPSSCEIDLWNFPR